MKKRNEKRRLRTKLVLLVVLALITAVAFVALVLPRLQQKQVENPELSVTEAAAAQPMEESAEQQTEAPAEQVQPEEEAEATKETEAAQATEVALDAQNFPVVCADGKLEIQSLFQFAGFNPDCGNAETADVAVITVKNTSEEFLQEADILVTTTNGASLSFRVTQLPAGEAAMAFSLENAPVAIGAGCAEVACQAEFAEMSIWADLIALGVEGTTVTLTNLGSEDLTDLVVYCRCPVGEEYFGGLAYEYEIEKIPAGGSATVDAAEACLLGIVEVVRITIEGK